jgi:putative transposase
MKTHKDSFPIERMSQILNVSRSGYYRCLHSLTKGYHPLVKEIKTIFKSKRKHYGYPRVHQELLKKGFKISKNTVAKLMRVNGLSALKKKRYNKQDKSSFFKAENILEQNFQSEEPNKKWVSDITYLKTKGGFVYLCVVMDLFSRRIIGHYVEKKMETNLVLNAFKQAQFKRGLLMKGLIFHTDQGSQYKSAAFQSYLKQLGVISSMSGKGNCYDNAVVESFFHTLKHELGNKIPFADIEETKRTVFEYIEIYYNLERSHSSLNYTSPMAYEKQMEALKKVSTNFG